MLIHQYDQFGNWTGLSVERDPALGIPYRWAAAQLPELQTGQYAVLNGPMWEVVDAPNAPPPVVPQKVFRRQALQALLLRSNASGNLLDQVPVVIAALDDGSPEGAQKKRLAEIEWAESLEFYRDRPLLIELAYALGLDDAGLDEIFIFAATL